MKTIKPTSLLILLALSTFTLCVTARAGETPEQPPTNSGNTWYGYQALFNNNGGFFNNAFGYQALYSNVTGTRNVADGGSALLSLTSGDRNVAIGAATLSGTDGVSFNTAVGARALERGVGDQNTALGFFAGSNLRFGGANNIYIGNVGPDPQGAESNTIRLGTQTATTATIGNPPIASFPMPQHTDTYIAGIFGSTTTAGLPVMVDSTGKLGTMPSSERFKEHVQPMQNASDAIFSLRPVMFRYKSEAAKEKTPQFGLIAEEVARVNPDLVARDGKGEIYSVRYEAVNAMLLNEFIKEHRQVQEQQKKIDKLTAQLKEQAALIQKVSAQVELSRSAPQVVNNH